MVSGVYSEVLPKSSKRSYSILRRNSGGRESSSSGVSGLSSAEGSGVESMNWLSNCSDLITGISSRHTSGSAEGGSRTQTKEVLSKICRGFSYLWLGLNAQTILQK